MILPRVLNATPESPTVPLTSETLIPLLGGQVTASGASVSPKSSLGIPAVWRAVNLIAGTIASLPLHAYRPNDAGGREKVTTGRAAEMLNDPHRGMTPMEFWEAVVGLLLLWGNAYCRYEFTAPGGPVARFQLLNPAIVKPGRTSDGEKVYEIVGSDRAWTDSHIFHIPGLGFDGVAGFSPITLLRQGLGLAMSAEEYAAKLFGSGSLATGILQAEGRLTQEQADALQARWKAKRAGLGSAHDTIVLDSGAKFHQLTIPPADAQFLESRSFQVAEIARIFGVPPHMLGDVSKSTSWGTGIEQQSSGFVVYTLRPWLTRIEQRITRVINPQKVYARFSVEGLLRGDSAQRAAFYTSMWNLGALSTNDIRALEEMPPVEGGDVRYRPLNMGELGSTDSAPTPSPTAPRSPRTAPTRRPTPQEATSA